MIGIVIVVLYWDGVVVHWASKIKHHNSGISDDIASHVQKSDPREASIRLGDSLY